MSLCFFCNFFSLHIVYFSRVISKEGKIKNFTCPYCIRKYNKTKVLYVCPEPCGFSSKKYLFEKEPVKCKISGCGGYATNRKCPYCGSDIPKPTLETPNLPFSIVGLPGSGKTNYITVMLHELSRASNLKLALSSQNRFTKEHQEMNYNLIYEKHRVPEATAAAQAGGLSSPQIWKIGNLQKKSRNHVPTYTFTIFDGAGEDYENRLDMTSTVCRYINISKAVIITLDPLMLPSINKGNFIDPEVIKNSGGYSNKVKNSAEVVNNLATYIKSASGIKDTKRLSIPVAIVLTKFDTILSHKFFATNALIKNPSLNVINNKINMNEFVQVDREIRNWLYAINEGNFIDALSLNFKVFCFFGVSSYGQPPTAMGKLCDNIQPHRVLDPILWLFKKARFID